MQARVQMDEVVGYARAPTTGEAGEGLAADTQAKQIAGLCRSRGWNGCRTILDGGASGESIRTRPGLDCLLKEIRAGLVKVVIVYSLDRLTRNLRDLMGLFHECFRPNGVSVLTVAEGIDTASEAGGRLMRTLRSFADAERDRITERMTKGRATKARKGERPCGQVYRRRAVGSRKHIIIYDLDAVKVGMEDTSSDRRVEYLFRRHEIGGCPGSDHLG